MDGLGDDCDNCPWLKTRPNWTVIKTVSDACDACLLVASERRMCVTHSDCGENNALCLPSGMCAGGVNSDEDAQGNACDPDDDDDGICDPCRTDAGDLGRPVCVDAVISDVCEGQDNCPVDANTDQADADDDGIGDVCEDTTDDDGDGIYNANDNCPSVANADQGDQDADGLGVCDNCRKISNAEQTDVDEDAWATFVITALAFRILTKKMLTMMMWVTSAMQIVIMTGFPTMKTTAPHKATLNS